MRVNVGFPRIRRPETHLQMNANVVSVGCCQRAILQQFINLICVCVYNLPHSGKTEISYCKFTVSNRIYRKLVLKSSSKKGDFSNW